MTEHARNWIHTQLAKYSLASDSVRVFVALVAAFLTRWALHYILVDLAGWLQESAIDRAISAFTMYFLFCVYYSLLCHLAFHRLDSTELAALLSEHNSKSTNSFIAFLNGESGTSQATMFSVTALLAVGVITIISDSSENRTHVLLLQISGLLTIIGSWISNVFSFALQYAREDAGAEEGGFRFPEDAPPVWSDYVYTAIMISTTLSTSDVSVVTRSRRRLISVHTMIAFTFNTVIIAMLVAAIM